MKRCAKCHVTKSLDQFHRKCSNSDGLQAICKACQKARDRAYYVANRDRIIAREMARDAALDPAQRQHRRRLQTASQRRRLAERRAKLLALKLTLSCVDCGWKPITNDEARHLEFDHVDPATKWRAGAGAFNKLWSWARILEEIALCEPRCKPCHMARTWRQRHGEAA